MRRDNDNDRRTRPSGVVRERGGDDNGFFTRGERVAVGFMQISNARNVLFASSFPARHGTAIYAHTHTHTHTHHTHTHNHVLL